MDDEFMNGANHYRLTFRNVGVDMSKMATDSSSKKGNRENFVKKSRKSTVYNWNEEIVRVAHLFF
jgi:hypothetical protein